MKNSLTCVQGRVVLPTHVRAKPADLRVGRIAAIVLSTKCVLPLGYANRVHVVSKNVAWTPVGHPVGNVTPGKSASKGYVSLTVGMCLSTDAVMVYPVNSNSVFPVYW